MSQFRKNRRAECEILLLATVQQSLLTTILSCVLLKQPQRFRILYYGASLTRAGCKMHDGGPIQE